MQKLIDYRDSKVIVRLLTKSQSFGPFCTSSRYHNGNAKVIKYLINPISQVFHRQQSCEVS